MTTAKAGDKLPDATVYEGKPDNKVKVRDVFKGKKGVLFGVPGAFTPGCSKTHLPGYISDYDKLTKAGAQVIACTSVNDAFVMAAWGEQNKADGKVLMLADTQMELTKGLGLTLDAEGMLGNKRCKRFSAVIEDDTITHMNVEPDGSGLSCSLASVVLEQLQKS
ncbi:g387 [Coccomyxa viridis]|uniref:Glutaredoxin-dependent peroxiredoxin n=1 Tax=Coccomyxa viridis TaxID=1274662 RepID=A0ABP1FFL2_9CHLO